MTISCSIHVDKLIMFKRCWGWKIKGWSGTKARSVVWSDQTRKMKGWLPCAIIFLIYIKGSLKQVEEQSSPLPSPPAYPVATVWLCPKTEVIHSSLNSTIARTSIMMIWKNTIKDLKLSTRIGARHCCINMQELLILYWMALNMKCVLRRLQISLRKYQNTAAIMQLQILKHNIFVRKWF